MDEDHSAAAGIPGLVPAYPNAHVATFKGFPWDHLLKILGKDGDRTMLDLILHCGIFISVENGRGNFYQLSG
jgi:telomerase reverse transcriptase